MPDTSFLTWPFFEDHHRALATALEAWAVRELPPIVDTKGAHDNVDDTCRALVAALGSGGWLRYGVPTAFGGVHENLDVRSLCIIREILARHSGLADFAFAMQGLGAGAISMFGSVEQKQAYLPDVATGRKIAAFALTEPDAGSDAAAMTTHLTPRGDHYLANGEKTYISNGGIADFYTLFARTDVGVSAIIVDANTPGLDIAERIEVIAPHPLARLTFRDCAIPRANLVDEEGRGFKVALATLDVFRTTVGAAALGFSRRALDEALAHARNRVMFGATLADLPIAQGMLAEMAVDVDASALLVFRSAWTRDVQKKRVTLEAAMAKLYATDNAQQVIDKAVQMLGGLGVTKGQKVEELYREVRALRIYEGASEVQKIVIARQLLQGV